MKSPPHAVLVLLGWPPALEEEKRRRANFRAVIAAASMLWGYGY